MFYLINFLKYLFFGLDFILITVFIFLLSLLPKSITKNFFPSLFKTWSLFFFRVFGMKAHIHEKFQKSLPKQFILISNHPSGMELMWLPSHFKVLPLSKYEIKDWFIIGRIVDAAGAVFVKRRERASRHAASEACLEALKEKKNIMIFPEGGCYGKALNPFYMGAFHLSKESGVPIIPVYVHYEEENVYEWGDYGLIKFILRALVLPKNRNGHLYIFDALLPSDFANEEEYHKTVYEFYKGLEQKYRLQ